MATLNGIDISSWQTGINLSAVPADFVLIKATEATTYVNPDCDRALQQALRAGKLIGVYHFARPGDARAQADFFIAKCKGYIGRAVLVLDWEANALPLGPTWAKAWLDRVHQVTGIRPLIYMSASVTGDYDWTAVVKANYGLWVAAYALGDQRIDGYRVPSGPKGVKYWPVVAIWQYTSSGRLSGWGGKLDLNIFYGDRAAWVKYAVGAPASGAYVPPVKPAVRDPFIFGPACTKLWQSKMGTSPDGVVSSQPPANKPFVVNPTTFNFTSNYRGGSQVVAADQRRLKAKGYYRGNIDGWCGPGHILARAKYLSALGFYTLGNDDNYWGEKHSEGFYTALKSGRY